jgi:hypothetical protein
MNKLLERQHETNNFKIGKRTASSNLNSTIPTGDKDRRELPERGEAERFIKASWALFDGQSMVATTR